MILILLTLLLAALKLSSLSFMELVSWWWVAGSFFLTFIWFEFFERLFGLDKKRVHTMYEEMLKKRVKSAFEKKRR